MGLSQNPLFQTQRSECYEMVVMMVMSCVMEVVMVGGGD